MNNNISRIGVYGVARKEGKLLVVTQERGPYTGRFDLPGGKIEFGETFDQALHREFLEEIGMDFESMSQIGNFSTCFEYSDKETSYTFHQIGLIYSVSGLKEVGACKGSLKHKWVDLRTLSQEHVSPFVWELIQREV